MNTPSPVRRSPPRTPSPPRRVRGRLNEYGSFLSPVRLNYNLGTAWSMPNRRSIVPLVVENVKIPNNKPRDPIGLRREGKFKKGNYAIRVRHNGRNTYFKPKTFNSWFGKHWRTLNEKSHEVISSKTHPLTRARVKRSDIKVIRFTS